MVFFSVKCWTITISFLLVLRISLPIFFIYSYKVFVPPFFYKRRSVLSGKHECFEIELKKEKFLFILDGYC